jgi:hypothetical protein
LAKHAGSDEHRLMLLAMSKAWGLLADQRKARDEKLAAVK